MYLTNWNPTEVYYERDALLRQEALNKRLVRRPLATLSTILMVLVAFVGLASIAVGPGRAIDYIGTHLLPVVGMLGVLVVVAALPMWAGEKFSDNGTKGYDNVEWRDK